MSVPNQIPIVTYTANGVTSKFPITFDLHDQAYLVVTVNKEKPAKGAYSVDGGEVVFRTPPNNGDEITLARDTVPNRDTNFSSYDNSMRPEVFNHDFDKLWHYLQEQNLVDAISLARIKEEIEWRRTHDFNYDMLAQVREKQIFDGLKQYVDTFIGATNPNIFGGVTAGVVFALDQKSVQTHLEEITGQLEQSRLDINDRPTTEVVNKELNKKANAVDVEKEFELTNSKIKAAEKGLLVFSYEADLLNEKPLTEPVAGKAYDTRKEWIWETRAPDIDPKWWDVGPSDVDLANQFTIQKLKEISAVNVPGEPILQVEDESGKVTMKQTTDAHLHLPHLEESVQESINEIKGLVTAEKSENLIEAYDLEGNIILRQSSDGDIHWAGSEKSLNQRLNSSSQDGDLLQIKDENEETVLVKIDSAGDFVNSQIPEGYGKRLNSSFLSPESNYTAKSKRFLIREDALHVINSNRALISSIAAPVPLDQVPLNYKPPQSLINLTVPQPEPSILDSTYRKNDGFVHPHLVQFHTNLNGFKYWLAITSYKETVDYAENAFVFGSNDLKQFHLFDDFPQPLAEKPAQVIDKSHTYNSDPFHFYDFQSCELCIGWRVTYQLNDDARLHIGLMFKSTKDGKHWSDIRTLMPVSRDNEKLLSPTIIYDFVNQKYLMYAVDPIDNYNGRKEIVRYECRYLGDTWVNRTMIETPREFTPWHLEVRYIGNSIALLVHDIYVNKNLFLGLSSDNGNTFNFGGAILEGPIETYKATFTPIVNEQNNTISLNYMWNSNHFNKDDPTQQWLTFSQKTQFVNL